MRNNNKDELIWLAGLFDGEGSVSISKRWNRKISELIIQVSNTEFELVEPFSKMFGGKIYHYVHPKTSNRKDMYFWKRVSKKAVDVLNKILPYMKSPHHSLAAKIGVEYQNGKKTKRIYSIFDIKRDLIYREKMLNINKRGRP